MVLLRTPLQEAGFKTEFPRRRGTQGRSQDFLTWGAQPTFASQTISLAHWMYCAHITGNLECF